MLPLSQAERDILRHWSMWGSDGYPVQKLKGNRWVWGPWFGINGPPVVFKTKRECLQSIERYLDMLLERNREQAKQLAETPENS